MEGAQIYDEILVMSSIEGGIQYKDFRGSWGVPTSQAGKGNGNIYGSDSMIMKLQLRIFNPQ